MQQYRKLPAIVEAVQLHGDNAVQVGVWCQADKMAWREDGSPYLEIETREGVMMVANLGDWIIKGVKGEVYPCKDDIFKMSYEPVKDVTKEADKFIPHGGSPGRWN